MTTMLEHGRHVCRMPGATQAELLAGADRRICVGSGHYPLPYYTNIDSDPNMPAQLHCTVPPLPFPDDSLDEVWACHLIEHMRRAQAVEFLAESYRALTPGGTCAIVVPDTRAIMQVYIHQVPIQAIYPSGERYDCTDLDDICHWFLFSTIQDSPHLWAWDSVTLARAMTAAGFVDLTEIDRYLDPRLGSGQFYQVGAEGRKP